MIRARVGHDVRAWGGPDRSREIVPMIGDRGHDLSGSTRSNVGRGRSVRIQFVGHVPGKQLVDAVDLVVRDMSEHGIVKLRKVGYGFSP